MRRRALLSALTAGAAGLAGCGAAPPDDAPNDEPSASGGTPPLDVTPGEETPTFTARDDGGSLSVAGGPVEAPDLAWTVEKTAPATPDHPCRLRVTLENTGAARDLAAAGALPFPVTPGRRTDGDDAYDPAIVPVDGDHRRTWSGACWRSPLDDPGIADDAPWDWGYGQERTVTLAAGERLTGRYHVVSSSDSHCFRAGRYWFARDYELAGREHEWSFTLDVPSYDRDG